MQGSLGLLAAGLLLRPVASFDVGVEKAHVVSDLESLWGPDQARAAVFSEAKDKFPKGRAIQAVELIRFISAYKQGVEALVDITPYSALLRAASDDDGELNFYAFIDTWVGNSSWCHTANADCSRPVVSMKGANGTCSPSTHTDRGTWYGNGFQVDINLVFWPKPAGLIDTRPRESVTVSSGWYGSYGIGAISVNEGTLINGAKGVQLAPDADFTSAVDAEVYPCPQGKIDVTNGVRIGKLAKQAHQSKGNTAAISRMEADLYRELADQAVDYVKVTGSDTQRMEVQVEYDPQKMPLEVGMPVFYEPTDIDRQRDQDEYRAEDWLDQEPVRNDRDRFQAVGRITSAANGKATVKMETPCLPTEASKWLPRLKALKAADGLERAKILSRSIANSLSDTKGLPTNSSSMDEGDQIDLLQSQRPPVGAEHFFKPFLVCPQGKAFLPMRSIGHLALNNFSFLSAKDCGPTKTAFLQTKAAVQKHEGRGSDSTVDAGVTSDSPFPTFPHAAKALANAKAAVGGVVPRVTALSTSAGGAKDGDKVCVLTRRATGRVFERSFAMPDFTKEDSVLLQFSSTGHGWSGSTEQCGEFCHAIYHFKINGQKSGHITEWRDDCARNPISRQFGTWELSRDGWCPGSVEPGLYIDVTKWMKQGENVFTVDVDVWSSAENKYKAYTNYGGFFGGDEAHLFVGASFFVYDREAVDAIRGQRHHFTAAEKALVQGSNMPQALKSPKEARPAFSSYLQQSLTSEALEEMEAKQGYVGGHVPPPGYDETPGFASDESSVKEQEVKKREVKKSNFLQQGALTAVGKAQNSNFLQREEDYAAMRYDFEKQAPWYLYSEAKNKGLPGKEHGAKVVKVFNDNLIQVNSREIFTKVDKDKLPPDWGQAALHIRLETPDHWDPLTKKQMEIDYWDRLGSAGLLFKASTSKVQLHPAVTPTEPRELSLA